MDKTLTRNKAQTAEAAAETCPHCGLEMAPHRCRQTPRGFYCQAKGLIFDPALTISSAQPDHLRPLIDSDPEVIDAAAELQAAEATFAKIDAEWREVGSTSVAVRNSFNSNAHLVYAGDGKARMQYLKGTGPADQDRLEQQLKRLSLDRDHAHDLVIRARERLTTARVRSRSRLQPPR
jgi:hypothetical protein